MALSPLSKNSIGIFFTLLLVILLSESRLFKIFTDTYLGRIILISILLFVSYLNKIVGTVCVFIIVIMLSIMKPTYEGFDDNKEDENNKTTEPDKNKVKNELGKDVSSETTTTTGGNNTTTPTQVSNETKTSSDDVTVSPDKKVDVVTTASADENKNDVTTIEGFDLQSTENNIRRGRQSNSIPVNQYNKQPIEVDPYEGSSFSNFFGLF
jgi:hypothetical protein